ncbi:uncharacterized protein LOC109543880 [Dendroctonus ponderosae]|uniref:uncharacterized protein LOC109543880 n=1 Tax=Dendroctonus ponderosae TaxID=77166 RepID=UPI0020365DA8|nr:uncharacterized protein LOC109543880 [Dendroctonus ponderosae]
MDIQPISQDSGNGSSPLDCTNPNILYKSTPKIEAESTPFLGSNNLKKRRFSYCGVIRGRNLDELLEICPSAPQASSTLNESLSKEFESIQIEQSYINVCDEPSPKLFKTNNCDILASPAVEPCNLKAYECTPTKSGIFQRCSSACSAPSPLKEQHDILYPTLKPLDQMRKHLTPQKCKDKTGPNSIAVKKRLYVPETTTRISLMKLLHNDVVMDHVFKYLSNGDLFRVSMVSTGFRNALLSNFMASNRCGMYKELHKKNKENYKITPPSSPESQCLFPEGSVSPSRINFAKFVEIGSLLNPNQSLIKCPKCEKPSVVEKCIAQCQQIHSCGYIFCQKCNCFAYNPEDFYDKCQNLALGNSAVKTRPQLEDLTNCSPDFSVGSLMNSTADNNYYSSGYFSGYDSSHSPVSVKRNLSASFGNDSINGKPLKALFESNRSTSSSSLSVAKREDKRKLSRYIAPVVKCDNLRKPIEIAEPPSPPKVKSYSACTRQNRISLKRLTR